MSENKIYQIGEKYDGLCGQQFRLVGADTSGQLMWQRVSPDIDSKVNIKKENQPSFS